MFADRPGGLVYTSKLRPGAAGHKEERRLKWRRRLPGPQILISNLNLKSQTQSPGPQISISNLNLKSQTSDLNLPAGQTHPALLEASRLLSVFTPQISKSLSSQISRLEGRPNLQSQILDLEQTRPQIPFGVGNLILQVSGL